MTTNKNSSASADCAHCALAEDKIRRRFFESKSSPTVNRKFASMRRSTSRHQLQYIATPVAANCYARQELPVRASVAREHLRDTRCARQPRVVQANTRVCWSRRNVAQLPPVPVELCCLELACFTQRVAKRGAFATQRGPMSAKRLGADASFRAIDVAERSC